MPVEKLSDLDYLLHFFLTPKGKTLLTLASPGGAGRNKTLGQKEFENLKFFVPEFNEQKKIASLLTSINKKINQLNEKHNLLKKYKKGLMQKLFSQELRFKDGNGIEFPKWGKVKLKECLNYEQPTKYLVTNTDYNDLFKVPVVTAGKTFILGYTDEDYGIYNDDLPVIIFDDFTTSSQFVDFPFKAKSSAMKILKATENTDIKFIFEAIQNLNYEIEGHNRHWISVFAEMEIEVPVIEEQLRIANFLSKIDEKIKHTQNQIEKVEQYKNGLIQKMFC
jgi:type I restriction enzyme S subunit